MTFTCRTWASGNAWPCDIELYVDPVVGVAAALAAAIAALGMFALLYMISRRNHT